MVCCFVPGCNSGYPSQMKLFKKLGKKMPSMFSCKKIDFQKWNRAILRADRTLSAADRVCELHFNVNDIERCFSQKFPDGSIQVIEREKPRLKPGCVPSIFPNYPECFLKKSLKRKSPAEQISSTKKIKKIGCPADVPDDISIEEPIDKITNHEESIYATGLKMTENVSDSAEHFITEHAETTARNIEGTRSVQSSTQTLPTVVHTLASNGPNESVKLLKVKLNTVQAENRKCRLELRKLQGKSRQLNKNIAEMEKFIYSYKANNWVSDASLEIFKTIPSLDNELLALYLSFQQSSFPIECLRDSIPCGNLSDSV